MVKKDYGFTLIELIITLAVIGVLVSLILVAINPQRIIEDTRDSRNRAEMNAVKTALQLFFNDNNSYPGALAALVPDYAKALPSVTTDASFSYSSSGSDYDAGVNLNNPSADDTATVTKCQPPSLGNYMVCPD